MSSPTFAQLLSEHLQRAGISDTELARSIGVRRQTVFRWKEGLVERPRAREDVLRCANKLRLTEEERDLLLLAAGFAPETLSPDALTALASDTSASLQTTQTEDMAHAVEVERGERESNGAADIVPELGPVPEKPGQSVVAVGVTDQAHTAVTTSDPPDTAPAQQPSQSVPVLQKWLKAQPPMRYVAVGLLLGLVIVVLALAQLLPTNVTPTPVATPPVVQVTLNPPLNPTPNFPAIYPIAQAGETLLIVAPFRGYTVNEQYNVAGRIREALEEEIRAAELISTTIAIWPEEISNARQLGPILAASDAALIIWGEYDSGRVRVNLDGSGDVAMKRDFPLSSPTELMTTITSTLPSEIRALALMVLGRLLRNQGELPKAYNAFERAISQKPKDPKLLARLYFYLGYIVEQERTSNAFMAAIDNYTEALAVNPELIDARYNRGTVYLNHAYGLTLDDPRWQQDLNAAIADFTTVITEVPSWLAAYQNRGVAYYERNGPGDQAAAIADFSHIIAVDRDNDRAYFHRALATLRADTGRSWIRDFEQTLALNPNYYPAINGLCWGYALAQEPETALSYCDEAVDLDPTGTSYDSRAIVYAQQGRYTEAIADFNAYLAWVEELGSPQLFERYRGPVVEAWIAQLAAGDNPFDRVLLDSLR